MEKAELPPFTCPCCGAETRNPMDVEHGYCGRCHWWTGDPGLGPPHLLEQCQARTEAMRSLVRAVLAMMLEDGIPGEDGQPWT